MSPGEKGRTGFSSGIIAGNYGPAVFGVKIIRVARHIPLHFDGAVGYLLMM